MHADPLPKPPHPFAFTLLIMPFGAVSGFVTVAIAYLAAQRTGADAISVSDVAGLSAAGLAPHAWKFFWAPVVDTTLTRKRWYVISAVLCAVGIAAMGAIPLIQSTLRTVTAIVFVTNLASTFLGMAVEGLVAHATPEDQRGRAGGWFQAGNLGGNGLGGGAGLWLAQHLPAQWMASGILGVLFLLCGLALPFVPEAPAEESAGGVVKAIKAVGIDIWTTVKARKGILCAILCFLPIGTGAAANLWSAVAKDWHASADTVALATGTVGGLVSAGGCLLGGIICTKWSARMVYAIVGALFGAATVAMGLAPRTELMYIAFTSLYALLTGVAYAAFTGFVLEAMGKGAAATKYNLFASLSNQPIAYMTLVDGWAYEKWNASGMLNVEAGIGVLGIGVLVLAAMMLGLPLTAPPAAPVAAPEAAA